MHMADRERCPCYTASLEQVSQVLSISKGKDREVVSRFCIIQAFRHKLRRGYDTSNTKWHILEDVRDICSNYLLLPVNII